MNNIIDTQLNPLETMSLADLRLLQRTSGNPIVRHAAAAAETALYEETERLRFGCPAGAAEATQEIREKAKETQEELEQVKEDLKETRSAVRAAVVALQEAL